METLFLAPLLKYYWVFDEVIHVLLHIPILDAQY